MKGWARVKRRYGIYTICIWWSSQSGSSIRSDITRPLNVRGRQPGRRWSLPVTAAGSMEIIGRCQSTLWFLLELRIGSLTTTMSIHCRWATRQEPWPAVRGHVECLHDILEDSTHLWINPSIHKPDEHALRRQPTSIRPSRQGDQVVCLLQFPDNSSFKSKPFSPKRSY
jgi:hypothetical protein